MREDKGKGEPRRWRYLRNALRIYIHPIHHFLLLVKDPMADSLLVDPTATDPAKRKAQEDIISPAMSPSWSHSVERDRKEEVEGKKSFFAKLQNKFRSKKT